MEAFYSWNVASAFRFDSNETISRFRALDRNDNTYSLWVFILAEWTMWRTWLNSGSLKRGKDKLCQIMQLFHDGTIIIFAELICLRWDFDLVIRCQWYTTAYVAHTIEWSHVVERWANGTKIVQTTERSILFLTSMPLIALQLPLNLIRERGRRSHNENIKTQIADWRLIEFNNFNLQQCVAVYVSQLDMNKKKMKEKTLRNSYLIFSRGQFSQPVVMQKYVSCGATWCMRWCLRGKITWWSWRNSTHFGKPQYVCDHLCICENGIIMELIVSGFFLIRFRRRDDETH